ncbi:SDR family oxidoreductase [Actinomadura spongiicola]|uniref:SDR family oxidoreductase n=1 Tax=Actinomadura spongiicola TaxID=2303421 RepID=A0A372GGM4_9ACTN|nr:SDR family oxidoreductase [Actinomadura spongiicola]RFS84525.1 SDR family oxidoreductase [Actinomadura spongiicola]
MDLGLSGRAAVVTGASRGIGLAIVRALTAEGVRVTGAARTVTPELKETGALVVEADLTTDEGATLLVERAVAELGDVDVLVNNVGGGDTFAVGGFLSADDAMWRNAFDRNFFSAVRVTRAAMPSLLRRRGTVINISSVVARAPGAGTVDYSVPKAALTALGKALDEEFGPRGVRTTTVSPGPVRTAFWDALATAYGTDAAVLLTGIPASAGMTTGRVIEPEEVADLVAFLASDRARSVAGSDHLLDGGALKVAS